ncbi:GspH/FimT family pseudopilin [Hahella sp. HN01]|uniref:GspH/FimT family pseudopilin n=1 Tax=Hahella sp. HN01 TaxID=2847262 RepID=UPI001C1EFBFF|nr:GspH/FimT family pseudopilin [Hahella sp. HN01]MBU6955321.1 GspH/FimT family pseudopilin [Hahella sp. HN01]
MKQKGFTLIELMVVLTILAIALAFGLPSMGYIIDSNRLTSSTNELVGALNFARSEAVKRGRTIRIAASSGGTGWQGGYRVWIDTDNDGSYDAGEEQLRIFDAFKDETTATGPAAAISFSGSGFASGATSIKLCSGNKNIATGRKVDVSSAGRVTIIDEVCS